MSTRSTTHFDQYDRTEAIVYRHSDGYPEGAGRDIERFLDDVAELPDTRFGDPHYLAAKYVVWLARLYAVDVTITESGEALESTRANRLDFLSVGVTMTDPGDIAYRYTLDCSGGRPAVTVEQRTPADIGWTWSAPVPLADLIQEGVTA